MRVQFVVFDKLFLEMSWRWLNDPELKALIDSPEFTKEQQRKWFDNLADRTDYLIWGLLVNDLPAGVCGIKNVTEYDCEFWGYIGEKSFWGKGVGRIMLQNMCNEAKKRNLYSIWLKVVNHNQRAIRMYKNNGFIIEKETNKLLIMRKPL